MTVTNGCRTLAERNDTARLDAVVESIARSLETQFLRKVGAIQLITSYAGRVAGLCVVVGEEEGAAALRAFWRDLANNAAQGIADYVLSDEG